MRDLAATPYRYAAFSSGALDIVRRFPALMQRATPDIRADAANALARAYLHCDLDQETRAEMDFALTSVLDDPSALVRRSLAQALASAANAPRRLVMALAGDQPDVARIVLAATPVLADAELLGCASAGDVSMQTAIARRARTSAGLAAAMAEIGERDAVLALAGNIGAEIDAGAFRTILDRFGEDGAVRDALLLRPDLPAQILAEIAAATARALGEFGAARGWLGPQRAQRIAHDAREQTFVAIAVARPPQELTALVDWLRANRALTVALLMRALMSGDLGLFRRSLANLAELPESRVAGLLGHWRGQGFAALYLKAGLPEAFLPAFRAALDVLAECPRSSGGEISHLMTSRLIRACEILDDANLAPIVSLLWRFAVESAREDAREFAADAAPAMRTFELAAESESAPTLEAIAIEGVNENFAPEDEPQSNAVADAA